MRIEMPKYMERLGALKIYELQKVLELSGGKTSGIGEEVPGTINIGSVELEEIISDMTIIVPVKDENPKVLEGVLSGIPHDAFLIIVSNSRREPIDRYRIELDTVFQFYRLTNRPFLMIHQRDLAWSDALTEAGYPYLLGEDGLVRNGKGEGMLLGLLLSKYIGRKYVGFIDSDNYIPGAVNEYVNIYAAGFYMAKSPYAMVRIKWPYKTKFVGKRFYFRRRGRVSEITNKFMNLLIARITKFETDIIKTSNAGEHAMTLEMIDIIGYSSGFSIEPYQIVYMLEEYSGFKQPVLKEVVEKSIEIFQIEPRNPHIHEERDESHIPEMMKYSLATIYHSKLADEPLKALIENELYARGALRPGEKIPEPRKYPPPRKVSVDKMMKTLEEAAETLIIRGF